MTESLDPERAANRRRGMDAAVGAIAIALALRAVGLFVRFLTHVVSPLLFTHYDRFPALAGAPKRAADGDGRRGDPVNLALLGTADEIARAFEAAGWTRAKTASPHQDLQIVKSILLQRPDPAAPVSPLYLFRREQDVAYERERGRSAGRRDHVRLWRSEYHYPGDNRPTWLATATLDTRPGVILRRLAPTHHIGPDIDEERDDVVDDLVRTGLAAERFNVTGLGIRVASRNASGDRYDTDGELAVIVLSRDGQPVANPVVHPDPPLVAVKNRVWYAIHRDRETPARSNHGDAEEETERRA